MPELKILPLTPTRWEDFAKLFGPRGACAGCWCMFWRLKRADWERGRGDANRRAMQTLVRSGAKPGLLAYEGDEAVGWVSVAPRETFAGLATARTLKPVDEQAVWSISCLFVQRGWRGRGVSVALLAATLDFVRAQGGRIVEGYPRDAGRKRQADAFIWNGTVGAFRKAGFKEVGRPSPTRAIMRYTLAARAAGSR